LSLGYFTEERNCPGNLVHEKYQAQTVRRTVRQTQGIYSLFCDASVTSRLPPLSGFVPTTICDNQTFHATWHVDQVRLVTISPGGSALVAVALLQQCQSAPQVKAIFPHFTGLRRRSGGPASSGSNERMIVGLRIWTSSMKFTQSSNARRSAISE